MDQKKLVEAILQGRFEWRRHTLERLVERGIPQENVLQVLRDGEEVEDYPDDTPYPSALYFGMISNQPIHVVAAFDQGNRRAYIVTAYVPDLEHFGEDYKTRRKK